MPDPLFPPELVDGLPTGPSVEFLDRDENGIPVTRVYGRPILAGSGEPGVWPDSDDTWPDSAGKPWQIGRWIEGHLFKREPGQGAASHQRAGEDEAAMPKLTMRGGAAPVQGDPNHA